MQSIAKIRDSSGSASKGIELRRKIKIAFRIVEADVLDHIAQEVHIVRYFSVYNVVSEHIAQGTTEIFMAHIRQETPGVGQHAHKPAEQSEI